MEWLNANLFLLHPIARFPHPERSKVYLANSSSFKLQADYQELFTQDKQLPTPGY